MKIILLFSFLLAVQLCNSQTFRQGPKEECQEDERDYRRNFYYQGRDHYYPNREYHQSQDYYRGLEYFSSCKDILYRYPKTPSGHYFISAGPDKLRKVYCEMEKEFCGSKGWERFYYMDFSKNSSHVCPEPFKKSYHPSTKSTDMKKTYYCEATVDGGCTTAKFPLDNTQYTEICAKIGGYQYGLPTAFKPYEEEEDYKTFMDGVYFSHGKDTKYLWAYVVGSYKHYSEKDPNKIKSDYITKSMCPDVHPKYKGRVPSFVESYYYCDSGAYTASINDTFAFFDKYRLFEGKNCKLLNYSCMRNGQPWFYRKSPIYFQDYIAMNSCNDDEVMKKDLKMDNIEIYLR